MLLLLLAAPAPAATIEVWEGDDLFAVLAGLSAGDEVIVHGGTYSSQQSGGSWFRELDLAGTEDAPIVIRAADGETPVIQGDPAGSQNIVNLSGQWYTLRGFELVYGSHGLRVHPSAHATLEDLHIHDTADVGLSMNIPGGTYEDMTVRGCHIHDTGGSSGECMYLGCNDDDCQVWDSLIELNWCHDMQAADQGDGIELKTGSYNVVIRHNVIHDTNYPGIALYGTLGRGINVVEGNVVARTLDHGIQVVGEVEVRNNIVIEAGGYGIYSKSSQGAIPTDLTIAHNTVLDAGTSCLRANNWGDGGSNITVANNALLCPDGDAVRLPEGAGAATFLANAVLGSDEAPSGTFTAALDDLLDAAGYDLYPAVDSALIDAGAPGYAGDDFNCLDRDDAPDVGAYEWSGADNPGWALSEGFKSCAGGAGDTADPDTGSPDSGDPDTGAPDSDAPDSDAPDSDAPDSDAPPGEDPADDKGCGCAGPPAPAALTLLPLLLLGARSRRRQS